VITLRDGSEVSDPRLGRLVDFDERSRQYNVREVLPTATLRSYTWSCKQWLDQRNQGACVAFAWEHELTARPCVVSYGTVPVHEDIARKRYWDIQRIDQWEGGSYPGADPFYEGTSVLAGAQLHKSIDTIREYRWAFSITDLALAVGYKGPAVLGVNWYTGMFDPDEDGLIKPTGFVEGGHAILCNGFSAKTRLFRLHNSWGLAWGVGADYGIGGGDCFIHWDHLEQLLHEDGEACVPVMRVRKTPPLVV
jgi:hypothetical protein